MNKTVTIESKNHKYQNTYGGEIYQSDFNNDDVRRKYIVERIFRDFRFDKNCAKKCKQLKEYKEYLGRMSYYEV